jgi:hypothetical protein
LIRAAFRRAEGTRALTIEAHSATLRVFGNSNAQRQSLEHGIQLIGALLLGLPQAIDHLPDPSMLVMSANVTAAPST